MLNLAELAELARLIKESPELQQALKSALEKGGETGGLKFLLQRRRPPMSQAVDEATKEDVKEYLMDTLQEPASNALEFVAALGEAAGETVSSALEFIADWFG